MMSRTFRIMPGHPFPWHKLVIAGAIACCVPAVTASAQEPSVRPSNIRWSVDREAGPNKVQLTIESRWGANSQSVWSNDRPIGDLQGLTAAQLAGRTSTARFAMVRDAGRLDCTGIAGNGRGQGECSFSVDPRFVSYLQQHGMGTPTPHQAFTLTMSGVGRDLIDSMQEIGYARPTVDKLASTAFRRTSCAALPAPAIA
jgi:hypothetical protein